MSDKPDPDTLDLAGSPPRGAMTARDVVHEKAAFIEAHFASEPDPEPTGPPAPKRKTFMDDDKIKELRPAANKQARSMVIENQLLEEEVIAIAKERMASREQEIREVVLKVLSEFGFVPGMFDPTKKAAQDGWDKIWKIQRFVFGSLMLFVALLWLLGR
jgi:hypothetical protein